jgi:hypothetical protein
MSEERYREAVPVGMDVDTGPSPARSPGREEV